LVTVVAAGGAVGVGEEPAAGGPAFVTGLTAGAAAVVLDVVCVTGAAVPVTGATCWPAGAGDAFELPATGGGVAPFVAPAAASTGFGSETAALTVGKTARTASRTPAMVTMTLPWRDACRVTG
jgi:hypothetical protein